MKNYRFWVSLEISNILSGLLISSGINSMRQSAQAIWRSKSEKFMRKAREKPRLFSAVWWTSLVCIFREHLIVSEIYRGNNKQRDAMKRLLSGPSKSSLVLVKCSKQFRREPAFDGVAFVSRAPEQRKFLHSIITRGDLSYAWNMQQHLRSFLRCDCKDVFD